MPFTLRTMLALALTLLGCASSSRPPASAGEPNTAAAEEPDPDPNRSVDTPGGHATFGFRASPGAEEGRVQVVGVLVDLDGDEVVTDLGEWRGELTVVGTEEGELVRLQLEGPENHVFVAVPAGDSGLVLLIDGRQVRRLDLEAAARIEAGEPLQLTAPGLLEGD